MEREGDAGPAATVRAYYEALRRGDPLAPFFADAAATAKFGIGESRLGGEAVGAALREQTRTTDEWVVESRRLRVGEREGFAWFSDLVRLAWTADERRTFDTRWSGALERDGGWQFVELHVSVAHDPADGTLAGFGTNVDPASLDRAPGDPDDGESTGAANRAGDDATDH